MLVPSGTAGRIKRVRVYCCAGKAWGRTYDIVILNIDDLFKRDHLLYRLFQLLLSRLIRLLDRLRDIEIRLEDVDDCVLAVDCSYEVDGRRRGA